MSGEKRMGQFVAWISPDRSRQVLTRVWPYTPYVAAVAPDGSVWTVGAVLNDHYVSVYANVLRHYSATGELLASTTVQGVKKPKTALTS
jgi:hypothetical protein